MAESINFYNCMLIFFKYLFKVIIKMLVVVFRFVMKVKYFKQIVFNKFKRIIVYGLFLKNGPMQIN